MMKNILIGLVAVILGGTITMLAGPLQAQTPGIISYQGRVLVSNAPFTGTGKFKFALVDSGGTTTFWSHDGTNGEPANSINLTVTNGLYSILLGDTTVANMTQAIPESVFGNSDVRLRVWFDDGANGINLLSPDQRIAAVGYAMIAKAIDTGGVVTSMLADGAVTPAKTSGFHATRAVRFTAAQSVPASTDTNISFLVEEFDEGELFTLSSPTRITIQKDGRYLVIGQSRFSGSTAGGFRATEINVNGGAGSDNIAGEIVKPTSNSSIRNNLSAVVMLSVGDFVELSVFQDAGVNVSVVGFLSVTQLP